MIIQIINAAPQITLISGVTASVSGIGTNSGYSINNIVNGQGLPNNTPSLTDSHDASNIANSWQSSNNFLTVPKPIQITFNFGVARNLTGLSFWNMTGTSAELNFGVRDVTFEYLSGATWTALTPLSPWTGAFTRGGAAPQLVNFSQVTTTQVRFNITTNFSGQRVGINEVQFKEN